MAEVKVFHDREGQTLTVWFTDPSLEYEVRRDRRRGGADQGSARAGDRLRETHSRWLESDAVRVALELCPFDDT